MMGAAGDCRRDPDRNLALELVRVTEAAAIAAAGSWAAATRSASTRPRSTRCVPVLASIAMDGIVVIGEGEKDEAPMLYNGEQVGNGSPPAVDIAVDPVDGTTLTAKALPDALAVIAVAERGAMFDPGPVRVHGEARRRRRRGRRRRLRGADRGQPGASSPARGASAPTTSRSRSSTARATPTSSSAC